jgi:GTP pyrophosphokinase/guanosine-3',5'-bis(diphosphate) 3'-pyrophosphohydrolase
MRIELQIRTEDMDRVAEEGVAAHWRYKDRSYGFDAEAAEEGGGRDPLVNLRHLVQVLEQGGDSEELVENAKLEMFLDQSFVFTPEGPADQPADGADAAGLRLRRSTPTWATPPSG